MEHAFVAALAAWFKENGRQMPWRGIKDPYRIWISEIIFQQTRIAQGWEYYTRFVAAFPDVQALANAEEDAVMRQWQGLGYYSRARNLHRAARLIMERGGTFPYHYEEVRQLPGVGDYTAAAITSFAYEEPRAVVDGNVYRVLSRYFGIEAPIDAAASKRLFAERAQALLNLSVQVGLLSPSAYNAAIMDFGALCCTPSGTPHCEQCPLKSHCVACKSQRVDAFPQKRRTASQRERTILYICTRTKQGVVLQRREKGDIWQGLYEMPRIEKRPSGKRPFFSLRHVLTHQILHIEVYDDLRQVAPHDTLLVPYEQLEAYAMPKPLVEAIRKVLEYAKEETSSPA